jgi:hypothetical protein
MLNIRKFIASANFATTTRTKLCAKHDQSKKRFLCQNPWGPNVEKTPVRKIARSVSPLFRLLTADVQLTTNYSLPIVPAVKQMANNSLVIHEKCVKQ